MGTSGRFLSTVPGRRDEHPITLKDDRDYIPRVSEPSCYERDPPPPPLALLIDRHPLFLEALSRLLTAQPLNAVVLTATRSVDALDIVRHNLVDLVLCDVRTEPVEGQEFVMLLQAERPAVRIILLADADDEALLIAALRSGASGFFRKDTGVEEFIEGICEVLKGHSVVGHNLVERVLAKLGSKESDSRPRVERLSQAERSILGLLGEAQSVRSIAQARGISQKTVRNHIANVYRKLELRNRTEAILWALRAGLVQQI